MSGNATGQLIRAGALALFLPVPALAQDSSFTAEGTDAVFGLGARHLAMGGTGTATANDTFALYYNPANLAGLDRPMATLGRQLDAELRPYSFIGFAVPVHFTENWGFDATVALGRYPRIHARSHGDFDESDFESIFLRFLLPGLKGHYDGDIDSKTLVNRLALGITPHGADRLSFGVNIDLIDCRTGTCGVSAGEVYSVHATAVSFGVSLSYRVSDRLALAAAYTDLSSGLDVTTLVTDASGTREEHTHSELPRRFNFEVAWQARNDLLVAAGYQSYRGHYGNYDLEISTVHLGAEWTPGGAWSWRAGVWAPVVIESSQFAAPELLFPVAPTLGVGWEKGGLAADLAVFGHPVNSMHAGRPVVAAEFSLTYRF